MSIREEILEALAQQSQVYQSQAEVFEDFPEEGVPESHEAPVENLHESQIFNALELKAVGCFPRHQDILVRPCTFNYACPTEKLTSWDKLSLERLKRLESLVKKKVEPTLDQRLTHLEAKLQGFTWESMGTLKETMDVLDVHRLKQIFYAYICRANDIGEVVPLEDPGLPEIPEFSPEQLRVAVLEKNLFQLIFWIRDTRISLKTI